MHHGTSERHATLVRGYAWHIDPDPATPGVFEGDVRFTAGDARGPGRPPYGPGASGVIGFWQVNKDAPGIRDDHRNGNTYLAIGGSAQPPPVSRGWFAEPARLDASFRLDRRGDRRVRLVRIAHEVPTPSGAVLDCEFQIDRS